MALSETAKVLLGAAATAAVGIVLGVVASKAAAPAAPTPNPTPGTTPGIGGAPQNFKAGERYALAVATTVPIAALDVATLQAALDVLAPGTFKVAMVTPAFNAATTLATYTVDVLQAFSVSSMGPFGNIFSGAKGSGYSMTVTVRDLGASPVAATAPTPATSTPPVPPGAPIPPSPPTLAPPPLPPAGDVGTGDNAALLSAGTAGYVLLGSGTAASGTRIRVTIQDEGYRQASPPGFGPGGRLGFEQFVGGSSLVSQQIGPTFFAWAPGDPMPCDWPADDPHLTDGWHFEFFYQNASLALTAPMIPAGLGVHDAFVAVWVGQGTGPTKDTTGQLVWSPPAGGQLVPGNLARLSFAPGDLYTIAQAVGFSGAITGPSCAGFLSLCAQTGFDQVVTGSPAARLIAWCGVDLLPPDWPPTDDLGNYHLELRYEGSAPVAVAALPFPVAGAWVAQGVSG